MEPINWEQYVDAIFGMHYEPYTKRKESFESELKKVGILDSPNFRYWIIKNDPSLFKKIQEMNPAHQDFFNNRRNIAISNTFAYYNILKECEQKGYDHVLTIEDDIRFDPDLERLKGSMEHLPPDYDFVTFDRIFTQQYEPLLNSIEPYNEWFYQNYVGGYWGLCFALWSKKAIKVAIEILEEGFVPSDYILINKENPKQEQLKRYLASRFVVWQDGQKRRYFSAYY